MADQSQIRVKNLVETYEKRIHRKKDNLTEHELRIKDKYIHLVTTMTHVEEMVVEMHRDQKLTDQEKESIEQFQSVPIRAKEELLNIVMKKSRDVYDAFLNALNNTKQLNIVQMLVSDVVVSPTEAQHPRLISRWYKWLAENLNTDMELIVALYRSEVLTRREREQLDCQKNRTLKNELLLSMLSRKSPDEFQLFKDALRETNQMEVAKKLDEETGLESGSTDEGHESSPTVNHRHGVRTTPVVKPSPLSLRPQLPPRPKAISPSSARPPSRPTDKKLPPANEVLSPRSPRSTTKLVRQISQPTSPAATEISLKVASIRQNITDIEEEILKKKANVSAQIKIDRPKEIKLKENRESTNIAQKVVEEQEKETFTSIVSSQTMNNTKEHNLQQKMPITDIKENGSLRRELEAANKRLESLKAEIEKLKQENYAQTKEFEKQLNIATNKCEEELQSVRGDLEKDTKLKIENENKLRLAYNELAHVQQELKRFSSVHEECITHNELLRQLDKCGRVHEEKLAKERKIRDDTEILLAEANKLLDDIKSKSAAAENEHKFYPDVNETLQELNTERCIRIEKEKLINDAESKLVEICMQLKEKELELENLKTKNKAILEDLNSERRHRIEQEQHLTETTEKSLELGEQMDAKQQELENLEEKNKVILQDLNNEKGLKTEHEQHLTETREKLLQLGEQMKARELELETLREKYKVILEDLNNEKRLRTEQEQHLTKPSDEFLELGEKMEAKEQELENLREKYKVILQDLNNAKRLRIEQEQHLTDTREKLFEFGEQMGAREEKLESLKEKSKAILQDLNNEKRLRTEQEQHLTETRENLLQLVEHVEAKEQELENLRDKYKVILQDLNNEKRLRTEQEQHLTKPSDELLELGEKLEAKEQELENLREKYKAILRDLNNEKRLRIEHEQHLTETRDKFLELREQMEAKEQELENVKEKNKVILQDLNNEKRLRTEQDKHLIEPSDEFDEQMEIKQHEIGNLEKEIKELLQNLSNEKRLRMEQDKLLSDARDSLLELGSQMEAKEQTLKTQEEEKLTILKEFKNEKRIRLEKEKLLSETNERLSELNKQMKATEAELKNREEELHNERRILDTNKLINKPGERYEQKERANKQEEIAENLEVSMPNINNKQQMRLEKEKYISDANGESEESIAQPNKYDTIEIRLQQEPELLREKKYELKKSLEQLLSRAAKKPEEQQPREEAQARTVDAETPVNLNLSASDFPESLTHIQLAPNLHVVRDRPIPHKNHLIRTHAGALARTSESSNFDDATN